jgi:anthranilate synthase component 1
MPRFCGGLAGYFGYDTVRHIEKRWPTPAER